MENFIIKTDKEFEEYIKRFELSIKLNLKEFEEIFNFEIRYLLQEQENKNYNLRFKMQNENLSEEEYNSLKEKLSKINERDNFILWWICSNVLKNNIGSIIEKVEKII